MKEIKTDIAIVGAGPAGLAAAVAAKKEGTESVLVIERDTAEGGILQQCIHAGFGLSYFGEELSGPEYAGRFYELFKASGAELKLRTTALEISGENLICASEEGMLNIRFKALILAMGCRERTRGNLAIPGSRPSGIFTAGTAQRLINIYGEKVGSRIVILGSGDIGMIMARRLTLEGAEVSAVVELMPYLAGLPRNKVQCLDDFGIPLLLSHTIVDIEGIDRISAVTVAPVDEKRRPMLDKAEVFPCDTLLLSVGLIPENELTKTGGIALSDITKGAEVNQYLQTSAENVFACGNVLHVNDLADNVSREAERAGRNAARYVKGLLTKGRKVSVRAGEGVRYVSPQSIAVGEKEDVHLFFRTTLPGRGSKLSARSDGGEFAARKCTATSPGTMEELIVPGIRLSELGSEITVSAIHEEAIV